MFKTEVPSKHEADVKKRKRILEVALPDLGPGTPVNAILKEKWIKVQEGQKRLKGPSNPRIMGETRLTVRTFFQPSREKTDAYL